MRMCRVLAVLFAVGLLVPGCKSGGDEKPDEQQEEMAEQPEEGEADAGEESITEKMADEHEGDEPTPTGAIDGEPRQPVETERVEYASFDGEAVEGYLAQPEEADGPAPGLIVIQEWWGLNENIEKMTERLAGEGYTALAVDLYEGEVAEEQGEAQELMKAAMQDKERLKDNLRQAHQYLDEEVGAPRIGVIGWCFGGGWSLQTALMLPEQIEATVIYYGELTTDDEALETLEMPILGLFGSEDTAVPPEQVGKFEQTLEELDKEAEIHVYEGANHAFANPSGERYDPEAAQDAWQKTLEFLETHLKAEGDEGSESSGESESSGGEGDSEPQ